MLQFSLKRKKKKPEKAKLTVYLAFEQVARLDKLVARRTEEKREFLSRSDLIAEAVGELLDTQKN